MVDKYNDDQAKYRATGVIPYDLDDIIGRQKRIDKVATTSMTVSGTPALLPENPLPRRDYISVVNTGGTDVAIVTTSGGSASEGYIISASGGTWYDETNAKFYIVSTGANSTVRVYERATSKIK